MRRELFLFNLPDGKCYKIVENQQDFEIYEKQINNEFVLVDNVLSMDMVKDFLKSKGYNGS